MVHFSVSGEHGHTLDEYIERDWATLRGWKKAASFSNPFFVLGTSEIRPRASAGHLGSIILKIPFRDSGLRRSTTPSKHACKSIYSKNLLQEGPTEAQRVPSTDHIFASLRSKSEGNRTLNRLSRIEAARRRRS